MVLGSWFLLTGMMWAIGSCPRLTLVSRGYAKPSLMPKMMRRE
uniref:Uncharacterized protein n=1 Tax=Anguilla anguilla TaxID=7936 RepID=A0A0E9R5U6_ANGAN